MCAKCEESLAELRNAMEARSALEEQVRQMRDEAQEMANRHSKVERDAKQAKEPQR